MSTVDLGDRVAVIVAVQVCVCVWRRGEEGATQGGRDESERKRAEALTFIAGATNMGEGDDRKKQELNKVGQCVEVDKKAVRRLSTWGHVRRHFLTQSRHLQIRNTHSLRLHACRWPPCIHLRIPHIPPKDLAAKKKKTMPHLAHLVLPRLGRRHYMARSSKSFLSGAAATRSYKECLDKWMPIIVTIVTLPLSLVHSHPLTFSLSSSSSLQSILRFLSSKRSQSCPPLNPCTPLLAPCLKTEQEPQVAVSAPRHRKPIPTLLLALPPGLIQTILWDPRIHLARSPLNPVRVVLMARSTFPFQQSLMIPLCFNSSTKYIYHPNPLRQCQRSSSSLNRSGCLSGASDGNGYNCNSYIKINGCNNSRNSNNSSSSLTFNSSSNPQNNLEPLKIPRPFKSFR